MNPTSRATPIPTPAAPASEVAADSGGIDLTEFLKEVSESGKDAPDRLTIAAAVAQSKRIHEMMMDRYYPRRLRPKKQEEA